MIVVNIASDFTSAPGARIYSDGPFSGQEFYEKLLKKQFELAIKEGVKLKVILDGVEGYTSSFINEAFSLLGNEFDSDLVWNTLIIVSNETPKYIQKVKESVYEKRK